MKEIETVALVRRFFQILLSYKFDFITAPEPTILLLGTGINLRKEKQTIQRHYDYITQ